MTLSIDPHNLANNPAEFDSNSEPLPIVEPDTLVTQDNWREAPDLLQRTLKQGMTTAPRFTLWTFEKMLRFGPQGWVSDSLPRLIGEGWKINPEYTVATLGQIVEHGSREESQYALNVLLTRGLREHMYK